MQDTVKDFELRVAKFLRGGVLVVAVFLAIGWMLQINLSENVFLQFQDYKNQNLFEVLKLAWIENSWGILISYAGLVVLVSLPIIRVLMTTVLFAIQKDYKMMLICMVVIFGLTISVLLGAVE